MQIYDIIMLAVIVAAIAFGAWKGLAWQLASTGAIVLSYIVALNFRDPVSRLIGAAAPWNTFLAMLILFLGTSLAVWIAFRFVRDFIDRVKLKEFDRQTGALLGAVKGVILCVIITLFAVTLLGENQKRLVCQSRSGYYISLLIDKVDVAMPSEVHDVLHPYLHKLDEEIQQERNTAASPATGTETAEGEPLFTPPAASVLPSDTPASATPPAPAGGTPTATAPGAPAAEGQSGSDAAGRLLRDAASAAERLLENAQSTGGTTSGQ